MYIYIYIHPLELFDQVDINDSVAGAGHFPQWIFRIIWAASQNPGAAPWPLPPMDLCQPWAALYIMIP